MARATRKAHGPSAGGQSRAKWTEYVKIARIEARSDRTGGNGGERFRQFPQFPQAICSAPQK